MPTFPFGKTASRMPKNDFPEYVVHDLLSDLPGMSYRAMFGGYGIYKDGLIIACIMDDELYLKVDDGNRAAFEQADSHPFVYVSPKGKTMPMSYWSVPADVVEDREQFKQWALNSYGVSERAAAMKKSRGSMRNG